MSMTTYQAGRYQAEVLDQGFEVSPNKGTPAFYLQLRILARYDASGVLVDCPQYERTYMQYLANETGVQILRGHLGALGVKICDLMEIDPSEANHVSLVGRQIDVDCVIESYQGQQRERWTISRRKKLAADALRALNDQYGHVFRDNGSEAKPANPAVAPRPRGDVAS
jgi:hypothetical protein